MTEKEQAAAKRRLEEAREAMSQQCAGVKNALVDELGVAAKTLDLLEQSGATDVLKDPDVVKALKPFMAAKAAKGSKGAGSRAPALASCIAHVLGSDAMDEEAILAAVNEEYPDRQFTQEAVKATLKKHTTGDRKRFIADGKKYSLKSSKA